MLSRPTDELALAGARTSAIRALRRLRSLCVGALQWTSAVIFITSLLLWIVSYFWVVQINYSIRSLGV